MLTSDMLRLGLMGPRYTGTSLSDNLWSWTEERIDRGKKKVGGDETLISYNFH